MTHFGILATVTCFGPFPIDSRAISARWGIEMIESSSQRVFAIKRFLSPHSVPA
jgi:hypothetical protein